MKRQLLAVSVAKICFKLETPQRPHKKSPPQREKKREEKAIASIHRHS